MNRREDGRLDPSRVGVGPAGTVLTSDGMVARWETPAGGGSAGTLLGWQDVYMFFPSISHGTTPTAATSMSDNGSAGAPAITINGTPSLTYATAGADSYYVEFASVFVVPGAGVTSSTVASVGVTSPIGLASAGSIVVGQANQQARLPQGAFELTTALTGNWSARVLTSTGTGTYGITLLVTVLRFALP